MKLRALVSAALVVGALAPRVAVADPLSLADVVERARTRGPAATTSAADVRIATVNRQVAPLSPLLNPTLEVFVDRGQFTKDVQVQSQLYLPFEVSGQRSARIEEAGAFLKWRQGDQRRVVAAALGEAVSAWGDLVVAGARLRDAADGERSAREEVAYYRGRLAANDATSVDVSLADAELGRWLQARSEAEIAVTRARTRLEAALGAVEVEAPATTSPEVPELRLRTEAALAARAAQVSPFLEAPGLEAQYWGAARERLVTERTPPLSVVLLGGRGDMGEARYGAGLSWQVPVTRRNQVEIARAETERDRAVVTRAVTRQSVETAVRGHFQTLARAREALATHDRVAIPAATAVGESATAAFKAGKTDLARVFLARRDLATARARRLDSLAAAWGAYAGLTQVLGELP